MDFTNFITRTKLVEILSPCFSKINNTNWDQSNGIVGTRDIFLDGSVREGVKRCVGCHIRQSICSQRDNLDPSYHYWKQGQDYLFDIIRNEYPEMTDCMILALFNCAGAPQDMFDDKPWCKHPLSVLHNLSIIKTPPPTSSLNTDLDEYYKLPEVKKWLKRERGRIYRCLRRLTSKSACVGAPKETPAVVSLQHP